MALPAPNGLWKTVHAYSGPCNVMLCPFRISSLGRHVQPATMIGFKQIEFFDHTGSRTSSASRPSSFLELLRASGTARWRACIGSDGRAHVTFRNGGFTAPISSQPLLASIGKHFATYPAKICPIHCGGSVRHSRPSTTILHSECGDCNRFLAPDHRNLGSPSGRGFRGLFR
jgi:hypothetical protein